MDYYAPHTDHMGAFNRIMQDDAVSITIDHLYTVEFPLEVYEQIARDVDDIDTYYTFLDTTQTLKDKNILSVEYLHEGDTLHLGDSQLKVYSEYTPEIIERNLDLPNSSSLIFKISGKNKVCYFLLILKMPNWLTNCMKNTDTNWTPYTEKPIPILLKIHSFI